MEELIQRLFSLTAWTVPVIILAAIILPQAIRILREYERGVIFRLGKLLGALMLFNRADPAFRLSLVYIIPATLITAAFFIFVVGAGLRAQFLPVRAGRETLLGKTAPALARIDAASGRVFVEGEYWNAVSEVPVEPGHPVEIVGINGLTLKVKPKQPPTT